LRVSQGGSGRRKRLLNLGEPVDADQPFRGRRTPLAGNESIPAAQRPGISDEALAGAQPDAAIVMLDDADLGETAGEGRRRLDMEGERLGAGGQGRIAGLRLGAPPSVAARRRRSPLPGRR
jgi:hypothetical protein